MISTQTSTTTQFRPLQPEVNISITVPRIEYDSKLTIISFGIFLFVVLILLFTWVRNTRIEVSNHKKIATNFWNMSLFLITQIQNEPTGPSAGTLGAILGLIFFFILMFLCCCFCLKCRKETNRRNKQKKQNQYYLVTTK